MAAISCSDMPVSAIVTRLALLLAVLLMPFGMSAASATPAHQVDAMAASPMDAIDCSGQRHGKPAHGTPADCTMACASALPAQPAAPMTEQMLPRDRFGRPGVARVLIAILLEIATPPPRIA